MRITEAYNSKAIASVHSEVASNKIPYLGEGLFPAKKKMSLDLKWIKTSKGLPVSLMPSAFDTVSTIRSREGFKFTETEMAYFKESMLVKEQDEQDMMRVEDSADPFAKEVLNRLFDDAETLIAGADVVPERMRMQLLSATNGHPSISIAGDGATYEYNYDTDGSYIANNFLEIQSATDKWDDHVNSDPMGDIEKAIDAVETKTGTRPEIMIISKETMKHLKQNEKIRNYILAQNTTATVMVTEARVKEIFSTELQISIVVYAKQYKDESGTARKLFPDGHATLIPAGQLGSTWYGCTPDERSAINNPAVDLTIVGTGVAVAVTETHDPDHTKTTVSEICLPSFERMDETFQIKCY